MTRLARLFGAGTSLAGAAASRPLACAGSTARRDDLIPALVPDPSLHDPVAFLRAHRGVAWLHEVGADGGYDHDTSVDVEAAVERFRAGTMMDLRHVQTWIPAVRAWLDELAAELGLSGVEHGGYCHAFVCPAGSGVPKHFDNRDVIVVQLVGRKRWELADNPALVHPLAAHVVGGPVHALNRHAPAEALAAPALPASAVTHVLEPGAALFVPRGTWHRTHALEASLSLSFGFRAPSRLEQAIAAAVAELGRDPAWRAPAYDVTRAGGDEVVAFVRAMRAAIARLRAAARDGAP